MKTSCKSIYTDRNREKNSSLIDPSLNPSRSRSTDNIYGRKYIVLQKHWRGVASSASRPIRAAGDSKEMFPVRQYSSQRIFENLRRHQKGNSWKVSPLLLGREGVVGQVPTPTRLAVSWGSFDDGIGRAKQSRCRTQAIGSDRKTPTRTIASFKPSKPLYPSKKKPTFSPPRMQRASVSMA